MKDWGAFLAMRDRFEQWYATHAYLLDEPSLYLGDEMNAHVFDWDAAIAEGRADQVFKVLLIDVNASVYAACSAAVSLFYEEFQELHPDWVVERAFLPISRAEDELFREADLPLLSVEGKMPVRAFDAMCFSQQMIGDEVNLVSVLLRAGLPIYARDRGEEDPLVIRGGSSSFNPSLIKDICDLFFIGEGEEILPQLLELVEQRRREGASREDILLESVQRWDCLFAPRFYEERFSAEGELLGMFPLRDDVPQRTRAAYIADLDRSFAPVKPPVAYCLPNRFLYTCEISRGCEGKCSFCVSGFTYMPFRFRSRERVLRLLQDNLYHTGRRTASLISFSSSSYPQINALSKEVMEHATDNPLFLSQRVDAIVGNPELAELICSLSGQSGVSFGVEGASQRLRDLVSKNCSDEQLRTMIRMLTEGGLRRIKFYLICGLPTEGPEDYKEMYELARWMREFFDERIARGLEVPEVQMNWSPLKVYPFVPFQWLDASGGTGAAFDDLCARLRELGISVTTVDENDDNQVVQLFLRGDSRLEGLVVAMAEARQLRHGMFRKQERIFADEWLASHDVPQRPYWLQERDQEAVFPWDFIDYGVNKEYLWRRYQEVFAEKPKNHPRCMERCDRCGACTPEHARRMAEYRKLKREDAQLELPKQQPLHTEELHPMLIEFHINEAQRFIRSDYWEAAICRALNYAGVSYARDSAHVWYPIHNRDDWSVGISGMVVGLREDCREEDLCALLNRELSGFRIDRVVKTKSLACPVSATYRMPCPKGTDLGECARELARIMASDAWVISKSRYRYGTERIKKMDVRALVLDLHLEGDELCMELSNSMSPHAIWRALFGGEWSEVGNVVPRRCSITYGPLPAKGER